MTHDRNRLTTRLLLMAVTFASLIVNVIVVFVTGELHALMRTPAENAMFTLAREGVNTPMLIFSFSIGGACMFWYCAPFFRYLWNPGDDVVDGVRARLINAPLYLSLIGIMGWMLHSPMYFIGAAVHALPFSTRMYVHVVSDYALTAVATFALNYYFIELVTRTYLMPRFFPEGDLSSYNARNVSIRLRFLILYVSIAVFPMFLAAQILLAMREMGTLTADLGPLAALAGACLVLGLFITVLMAWLYQKPLIEMKMAAERIKRADFEINVSVESTDEIGRLGEAMNDMARGLKEKEFIKETFGKVVDPNVRDYLLKGHVELGGETLVATVLFCDIRGFTTLSEKLLPDMVVSLLNTYFDRMNDCITTEGGVVNKYIGDAVMAIFGAPVRMGDPADAAVAAAHRMLAALDELNAGFEDDGLKPLRIGIGIHTGPVLAGNIGAKSRMEFTVIGDTVNIASRVEGLCKALGHPLLITEATADALHNKARLDFISEEEIRGRSQPIKIYSVKQ